mgnify:CR=1 FL=1
MAREMIKIEKLNKSFGDLQVLKNIDMTIHESDVVCLVGSSGSGKSTLLRCINYLEKKNSGKIIIEGEQIETSTHNINEVRQKIGMVFQHFNLFPHMTVIENVIEAPVFVPSGLFGIGAKITEKFWPKPQVRGDMKEGAALK